MLRILALYLDSEGANNIMSFKSWFVAFEDAWSSWLGFGILILILIWSLVFTTPIIHILALYLDFKAQGTSISLKSLFGALEDTGGSWLEFGILIFIWIWSLVFSTPIFWILALYLDFEGAKNIHVQLVLIWGFGGCWRFLTGVWHFDLDLDMVTGLWYNYNPNFGFLSWFEGVKNIHVL